MVLIVILMVLPGVAYAGGGGADTSGCAGFTEGTAVTMRDSCFAGTAHFAPGGSTITISNDGALPHTLTAVDGSFDTGQVAPGASTELTIEEAGIYRVFCTLHGTAAGEGMAGVVVVGEAVPASVAAPLDITPIKQAVAEDNEALIEAMDRQGRAMGQIRAAQTDVAAALDGLAAATGPQQSESPQIVTVPVESGTESLVLNLAVGLAAGLALAALLVALRLRRTELPVSSLERLEPSVES